MCFERARVRFQENTMAQRSLIFLYLLRRRGARVALNLRTDGLLQSRSTRLRAGWNGSVRLLMDCHPIGLGVSPITTGLD